MAESASYDLMGELLYHTTSVRNQGVRLPQFDDWTFFAKKLFERGVEYHQYAISLADKTLQGNPFDSYNAVLLASLYRQTGELEYALDVFDKFVDSPLLHRAFYAEWAECKFKKKQYLESLYLSVISVSDGFTKERNIEYRRADVFFRISKDALNHFATDAKFRAAQQAVIELESGNSSNIDDPIRLKDIMDTLLSLAKTWELDLPDWVLVKDLNFALLRIFILNNRP